MVAYRYMKKTILTIILTATVSVFASQALSLRVDTTEIYGNFQDANLIKTYKFKDGAVTCYGQIFRSSANIISSQAISCVK